MPLLRQYRHSQNSTARMIAPSHVPLSRRYRYAGSDVEHADHRHLARLTGRFDAQVGATPGPGMGEMVGPAGNYATIPDLAKWLLSFGMLLGRLEILTVLVLLFPAFWRH